MLSCVKSDLKQIKIESVPDIQYSSMAMKTPTRAESDRSDIADIAPPILANVQSTLLIPDVYETTTQDDTSISKACVVQSPLESPILSPEDDGLLNFVQLHASIAAKRKRKMFNASLICEKRWEKLCPSDRMRLYELVQLRSDALSEAITYLNIPPFPTADEMTHLSLIKRKRTSSKRSSKKTAKRGPQAQKPAMQKTSSLQTGSTSSFQKKAAKVPRANQQVAIYAAPTKHSKQAGSTKRCH